MSVVIYHNPDCGTSRNTLALIRHYDVAPKVVEYLKTPPARSELADLIARAGLSERAVLRRKGTPYAELGLDNPGLGGSDLLDAMMAYGGLEPLGEHVLVRSIAVLPAFRGKGIGRNIVPLLLYRAYRSGARTAWLLTDTAAPFFEKIGFRVVDRQAAPAAVLATRQTASLCPASAPLLSRSIGF